MIGGGLCSVATSVSRAASWLLERSDLFARLGEVLVVQAVLLLHAFPGELQSAVPAGIGAA